MSCFVGTPCGRGKLIHIIHIAPEIPVQYTPYKPPAGNACAAAAGK